MPPRGAGAALPGLAAGPKEKKGVGIQMTFQLPVILWTVICFVIFMLVVDRLLFRPVLAVMDQRRAKIDAARALSQPADGEENADASPAGPADLSAAASDPAALSAASLADAGAEQALAAAISEAESRNGARLLAGRRELDLRRSELKNGLEDGEEQLAAALAAKLIS